MIWGCGADLTKSRVHYLGYSLPKPSVAKPQKASKDEQKADDTDKLAHIDEQQKDFRADLLKKILIPVAGTATAAGGGGAIFFFVRRRKLRFHGILGEELAASNIRGKVNDDGEIYVQEYVDRVNCMDISVEDYIETVGSLPCVTLLHPDYQMTVTIAGASRDAEKASEKKLFEYLMEAHRMEGEVEVAVSFLFRGDEEASLIYVVR